MKLQRNAFWGAVIWAVSASAALPTSMPFTGQAQRHHQYAPTSNSDYYTAKSGDRVHRPIHATVAPRGATAQCRDDTWSFSENHRGTCSHHGGVSRWLS